MDKKEAKNKHKKNNSHLVIPTTFGQRAADKLAKYAGSWTFIISFFVLIIIWMATNTAWLLFNNIWDPYPFILLNLVLSCLAAIQAPVILMSQNRSAERDRIRSEYDYAVNRSAAKEIQQIGYRIHSICHKGDRRETRSS